jgi:hypothetical protein
MYTEIPGNELERMHIRKIDNLEKTIAQCVSSLPENAVIYAIPNGHAILPVL